MDFVATCAVCLREHRLLSNRLACHGFKVVRAGLGPAYRSKQRGDADAARDLAGQACDLERRYGDSPTWGPFSAAVEAWADAAGWRRR